MSEKWRKVGVFFFFLFFFIFFQLKTVYGGDSGDYLSAAAVWGIPHPPGYPLFAFLAAILHNFLPLGVPAWRVAFLSSIPAALTILVFYKLLRLFFSSFTSLISSLFLAFLYPFWLYSEVVEVFSLNNFFIVSLTYLVFSFLKSKEKKYLSLFFILLGFSLAHHHTILFLFPALFLIGRTIFKKKDWRKLFLLLPGLAFYLYLPLAARKNPAINWGNPATWQNFLSVLLRRGYGTFLAHPGIDNSLSGRFLNVLAFGRFLLADFSIFGLVMILFGASTYLFIKSDFTKRFWRFSLVALLSFTFFLFYASFRLEGDFQVATYERFLIVPYIFLTIFLAFGIKGFLLVLERIFKDKNKRKTVFLLTYLTLLVIFPLNSFLKNFKKISILKTDLTAERFGQDILNSLPPDSGVFLVSDTTWFNTAYVYYSLGYRQDEVKLLNWFSLPSDYYQEYLKDEFPGLILTKAGEKSFEEFVKNNWQKTPIYIIPRQKIEGFSLVPFGLLFRYYPEDQQPALEMVIKENEKLWSGYHDPFQESLKIFKNLFLADVPGYYRESSKRLGEYLVENKEYNMAEKYLKKSLAYDPEDAETYLLLGRVYLEKNDCQQAENNFLTVKKMLPDNPFPDAYLRKVYLNCYQDESKAQEFLNACFQKEQEGQIKLEGL